MAATTTGKLIKLDCYGIEIMLGTVDPNPRGPHAETIYHGGSIKSELKTGGKGNDELYAAAIDGLEALLLALAVAGVNLESHAIAQAIEAAVEAISNHHGD